MLQRMLSPIVEVRKEEAFTTLLMFSYSFLAMTGPTTPSSRSPARKFIADLGADNLPYILLAAGLVIGILMTGYAWRWPGCRAAGPFRSRRSGWARLLLVFWVLFQESARVGVGRVLPRRPHSWRAAHQPVLDGGQPRLRPAAGQAIVRFRRRRRAARRHRRQRARPWPRPRSAPSTCSSPPRC